MSRSQSGPVGAGMPLNPGLRHDVRNYLRDQIFDGTLQPGDRIVESRLARELGISQTPVREALRELEQMGLVVSYPNRGASVRRLDPKDVEEMYVLRAHLEVLGIDRAIGQVTEDDLHALEALIGGMQDAARNDDPQRLTELDARFHEYILERADHALLLRTWQGISPLNWTMLTVLRLRDRNLSELAERHRPIVEALRSGDRQQAEAVIHDHVLSLGERVVGELRRADPASSSDAG
ncbi:MAG: GntR family transcriptional regulator [Thermomicrobiales bacterium]